jgi:hypothetical protein
MELFDRLRASVVADRSQLSTAGVPRGVFVLTLGLA